MLYTTTQENLALRDVRNGSEFPRGSSKFFNAVTGSCNLCVHHIGKKFTHQQRVDHQQSEKHVQNYQLYKSAFERFRKNQIEHESMMNSYFRRCGIDREWIEHGPGEKERLKAALFDLLSNPPDVLDTDITSKARSESILTHQATQEVSEFSDC